MEELINEINFLSTEWLNYKNNLNECAYTDSLIEMIIDKTNQLGTLYNKEVSK